MRILFLFLLFLSFSVFSQTDNTTLQDKLNAFCQSEGLENAAISFAAYDITKDSLLAQHNPNMAIPSASTTKLFTTAAALQLLGKNYRPKTEFYALGTIDSLGILHGNLIVRGLGDPTLGSHYFTNDENKNEFLEDWVKKIKEKGITKIDGRIIADGSAFGYEGAPDGWTWSDMGNYYGAGPSACALYDNMTHLYFSTPQALDSITQLDSMTPYIPNYILYNHVKTSNSQRDNSYIYGAPYSYQHFAIGTLPRGRSNFEVKASIPDPEELMSSVFSQALKKDSIPVLFPAEGWRQIRGNSDSTINYAKAQKLFTYKGETLKSIIDKTNLWSINLFAEQILCLIGYEKTGLGTTSNSVTYLNRYWENRLGTKQYQTDGCGLSRSNAFSANHFIYLLKYMHHSKYYKVFEGSLPVAGKSGTLRSVCYRQAAAGRIHAKSGTLTRVKAYAGYVHSKGGNLIAFSIIVNNDDLSNYRLIKKMEVLFNAMAQY